MKYTLALFFFLVALGIMIHHYLVHGYWVDWGDVDNHETIALFFAGLGVGTILALSRRRRRI